MTIAAISPATKVQLVAKIGAEIIRQLDRNLTPDLEAVRVWAFQTLQSEQDSELDSHPH